MPEKTPLIPGRYYHVFNRGNNRDNIFYTEENYLYFLRLYKKHVSPIAHTYAYALLPNHYHFLIKIKDTNNLPERYSAGNNLSKPLGNWQNAYAKAINKQQGRVSSLFEDRFERVEIKYENRFTDLICYIHFNPEKHGYCNDYTSYPSTSYASILSNQPTSLERSKVLDWFGGRNAFIQIHAVYKQEREMHRRHLLDDY